MITTDVSVGTACEPCRKLGHYCRSVIAMDAVPYCDSCYDDLECAAAKAHRIRITGLGGEETGTFSGPVKHIELSTAERKPFKEIETKTPWRAELERRSAEDRNNPKFSRARVEPKYKDPAVRHERKPVAPIRFCACGKRMKGGNMKGICNTCSQKNGYRRVDMRRCKHEGCLEKINSRNIVGFCRWHNPNNMYRTRYKNSQPKMKEAA